MVLFISLAESSQSYATKIIIELNKGGNECNEKLDFFLFLELQLYVLVLSQVKDLLKNIEKKTLFL